MNEYPPQFVSTLSNPHKARTKPMVCQRAYKSRPRQPKGLVVQHTKKQNKFVLCSNICAD